MVACLLVDILALRPVPASARTARIAYLTESVAYGHFVMIAAVALVTAGPIVVSVVNPSFSIGWDGERTYNNS